MQTGASIGFRTQTAQRLINKMATLKSTSRLLRVNSGTVLINAAVFFTGHAPQFALAHEVSHHVYEKGIDATASGLKLLHPCIVADWLAAKWSCAEELRTERLSRYGAEYCNKEPTLPLEEQFLTWALDWLVRFRTARLCGRPLP